MRRRSLVDTLRCSLDRAGGGPDWLLGVAWGCARQDLEGRAPDVVSPPVDAPPMAVPIVPGRPLAEVVA